MPQLTSPLSTPAGMSGTNPAHRGKFPAPHFPDFAAFTAAVTPGATGYAADTWAVGQTMSIATEDARVRRVWNGTHARTALVGTQLLVLLADTNTVLSTTGAPSSGTGANGDVAIDFSANKKYANKASGTWPAATDLVPGASVETARGAVLAQSYASSGVGSTASPFISTGGSGAISEAALASYTASGNRAATVQLGDAEYRVTTPVALSGNRTSVFGTGAAWADDPNAEARPGSGSMLVLSGTAMAALVLAGGSGVTLRGFSIWGRGRNHAATFNNAGSGYNAGIRVNARHDKLLLSRLFVGMAFVGLQVEASTQLDVWTVEDCGFIGNWFGIHLRDTAGSIMSNWSRLTISDNDGPGFQSDVLMYRNKISGCNIVRNCRGMTGGGAQMQVYGPGTIVTANDFSEAGLVAQVDQSGFGFDDTGATLVQNSQRSNIDDLRIHGADVQVYGNQFQNHFSPGGACVHVMSDATGTYIGPNLWSNNSYNQIQIDAGAQNTTIVMAPGLNINKIVDNGTNTKYIAFTGVDRATFTAGGVTYAPPALMQTAKLWVSADQNRTLSGSNVTALGNRLSSGGFDATADSTPKPTVIVQNGLNALDMTNSSYLTFPSDASYKTASHTIYFVGRCGTDFGAMCGIPNQMGTHVDPYFRVALYRGDAGHQYLTSDAGADNYDVGQANDAVHIFCMTTGDMKLYNESNVGTGSATLGAGPFTHTYPNATAFRIGANGINGELLNGVFCEMACFSGTHDAAQRLSVINYLKRWVA